MYGTLDEIKITELGERDRLSVSRLPVRGINALSHLAEQSHRLTAGLFRGPRRTVPADGEPSLVPGNAVLEDIDTLSARSDPHAES
jgi:hypothetical protein